MPLEHQDYIDAAVRTILLRRDEVRRFQDACAGKYEMTIGSDRFRRHMLRQYSRLADNLAPRVVSAVADRLTIKSIDPYTPNETTENEIKREMRRIDFDEFSNDVHYAALRDGAVYVVGHKDETGSIHIALNTADVFEVARDDFGRLVAGVKVWTDDSRRWRMTVYYKDRTERYYLPNADSVSWAATILTDKPINYGQLQPFTADGGDAAVSHGFKSLPVVPFINQPDTRRRGVSELASVLPLQLALNAAMINLLSSMEAWSLPTRYITGLMSTYDDNGNIKAPELKAGGTWVFGDTEVNIGQLPAADLRMAIESINDLRHEIARVSGIPIHMLQLTTAYPSGDALKVAESSLIGKIRDRQIRFGNAWENVFSQLLIPNLADDLLNCRWESAEIVSQLDSWQAAVLQRNAGVSLRAILQERGYTDPEIDKILEDRRDEDQANQELTARLFNGGNVPMP
jgi:hypothetical protein